MVHPNTLLRAKRSFDIADDLLSCTLSVVKDLRKCRIGAVKSFVVATAIIFMNCGATAQKAVGANSAQPESQAGILVELFTSEGCSSCPPADELLRRIDSRVMPNGYAIVVLGEHVDYWDGSGWHDRFSSRDYTERQQEYARRLNTSGPYTPEIVVDGRREFVGNDGRRLQSALAEAATKPKISVVMGTAELAGSELILNVRVGSLPRDAKPSDLYIALADNSDETRVGGGENSGRTLHHVAAAQSLQKIARVGTEGLEKQIRLRIPKSVNSENLRAVAYIQEKDFGAVLGAATLQVSEPKVTR